MDIVQNWRQKIRLALTGANKKEGNAFSKSLAYVDLPYKKID